MYKAIKRFFDLFFSGLMIILLSPLMIPIMIGLKLTGEHYIFYLQERIGYKNRKFNIYKFATMLKNSPNMAGGLITTQKDPRILPMGGFLRKTKINELPQLFNIFLGQMSFVGPRPLMEKSFNTYTAEVRSKVYNSKPGLTGIGSIVFRDEEAILSKVKEQGKDTWMYYSEVIYPHKGQLELWYQNNKSFRVDLKILLATVWVVIFPESSVIYSWFKGLPERKIEI